jgi:hypothetical protein
MAAPSPAPMPRAPVACKTKKVSTASKDNFFKCVTLVKTYRARRNGARSRQRGWVRVGRKFEFCRGLIALVLNFIEKYYQKYFVFESIDTK